MTLLKLLVLVIMHASSFSWAQSDADFLNDFRSSARSLIQGAILNGYPVIDGISLNELLQDIEKPRLILRGENAFAQESGREGAYYSREFGNAYIEVRKKIIQDTPAAIKGIWSLHEHLGVSERDDRDYNLSLQIFYAAQKTKPRIFENLIAERKNSDLQNRFKSGGSGTNVGGGGDPRAIYVKLKMIDALDKQTRAKDSRYSREQIEKMLKIATDCTFNTMPGGTHAIHPTLVHRRAVYDRRLGGIDYPEGTAWAKVNIDPNWLSESATDGVEKLLLEGLNALAEAPFVLCDRENNIMKSPGLRKPVP